MKRFGAIAALLVLLGLVGACSSGSGATSTAAPVQATAASDTEAPVDTSEASFATIDPCSLITQKQAETLVGAKLQAPVPLGDPPDGCEWTAPPTAPGVHQVEIDLGDGAEKALQIDRDTLQHTFTTVPGLGDEASAEDGAIFFRKGNEWVKLSIVTLDDIPDLPTRLVTLAQAIAAELP